MSDRFERLGWKNKAFDTLNALFLLVLMLTMIVPFVNVLALSFSSGVASMQPDIVLWPKQFSAEGYKIVWKSLDIWRPLLNSVIVTLVGTTLHVLLSSLAGYVFIYPRLPGRKLLITFILITMMVPQEAIMIPLYVVNKDLHLINTLSALVLSGLVSGFSILLMRNFFLNIPFEMSESAKIDGAGEFRIFSTMYLRLAAAGLATVTLFEFVGRWNMFTAPVMFISDSMKYTLQVALKAMIIDTSSNSGTYMVTTNVRMAGIVISILPLIAVYPFVQKYFMKGILLGASKE
ncbi:carbohydrate ABC transporter permease [Paenibacillus sp. MWE-103]|uniref:Carbohydrate ABC transporter permease n=1 Tax=Paenibacillus artemisiicola TaxID=1172618 RepID=A0ABS3WJT7_9BACL|nr:MULTISPECIES: carbohydrate ABC transporter permease [Paenibacillus]MBO7748589.1 carbohydrate ABC transporter permease [Paenibacillus artemisiicola]SFJ72277.1 putative aldouronate transport system permease protein [Paenibacillus sp. UNC496MF]